MPLMLVCFSRFIVDLTFVLLKRNLSLHLISVLLTYTTAGRLPLDVILLYNNQKYTYQMRLFQIRLLYWKKSLILIQEKNTYDNGKCEALLLDSLKDHGSLTKPEIVRLLWDVLPDQLDDKQKNNKLDYLLKRLRKAGKIWTERNVVTSVWHLTEK